MTIRQASRTEAKLLSNVIRASFKDIAERFALTQENCPAHPSNCTPERVEQTLIKGAQYFLAETAGQAVGCVGLQRASSDVAFMERLAVLPEFRRQGFGQGLVEHAMKQAARQGARRVELGIIAEHLALRDWYLKLGFQIERTAHFDHLPFEVMFLSRALRLPEPEPDYLAAPISWDVVDWYDEVPLWSAPFGLVLLEYVPMRAHMRVLDLGCGTGFPLIELAQRLGPTCHLYGLDTWRPALVRAGRKVSELGITNTHVIEADGGRMPLPDNSFDLVVSNLGINNFDQPVAAVAECARVLRPGGTLIVTTNLRGHMWLLYDCFEAVLKELGREDLVPRLQAHVDHRITVDSARSVLSAAGFVVCRTVQASTCMRFLDGSTLMRHSFIRLAFLDGWRGVVPLEDQERVFRALEAKLNDHAAHTGELKLVVPMAYVEAKWEGREEENESNDSTVLQPH